MKKLKTILNETLVGKSYDKFFNVAIISDSPQKDQELADFLIEKFKVTPDEFNALCASSLTNDEFEKLKSQVASINSESIAFDYEGKKILITKLSDESGFVYVINYPGVGNYILY